MKSLPPEEPVVAGEASSRSPWCFSSMPSPRLRLPTLMLVSVFTMRATPQAPTWVGRLQSPTGTTVPSLRAME